MCVCQGEGEKGMFLLGGKKQDLFAYIIVAIFWKVVCVRGLLIIFKPIDLLNLHSLQN